MLLKRFIRIQIYNAEETSVEYDNEVDTTWGITTGTLKLNTQMMGDELKFGQMFSSRFEAQLFGIDEDLVGRKIVVTADYSYMDNVSLIDSDNNQLVNEDGDYLIAYQESPGMDKLFTGYIETSDKDIFNTDRNIIAYDAFYWKRDLDVTDWWNLFWETNSGHAKVTDIRSSLLQEVGLSFSPSSTPLPNENFTVTQPVFSDTMKIKFGDILPSICEMTLCCPHINGDGVVELLTPSTSVIHDLTGNLEGANCKWEDYTTNDITGVAIYHTNDQLAGQYTDSNDNIYNMVGNILLLDEDNDTLVSVAHSMYLAFITWNITYTPCDLNLIAGDLRYHVGDQIVTEHGNCWIFGMDMYGSQLIEQEILCRAQGRNLLQDKTNYNQELVQGSKFSSIEHNIDAITFTVGETKKAALPIVTVDVYTDGVDHSLPYTVIDVGNVPYEIFGDKWEAQDFKFGIRLTGSMSDAQMAKPKEVQWATTPEDSSAVEIYSAPIYIDNQNTPLIDTLAMGEVIYLQYSVDTSTWITKANVITDSYSQAQINITNNQIVMKVDSNGNIGTAVLSADPDTSLSSFEINVDSIRFKANSTMDLSAAQLSITSQNFSVDTDGNVVSRSFTVVPSATQHGAFRLKDADDNILGSWGGNYRYEGIEYHQLSPVRKDAYYDLSKADFIAQNIYSNGSGDVTGGFTTHMKWDAVGLELQLLTDPYAVNEEDRTSLLQFYGDYGAVEIYNYGKDCWGTGVSGLRNTILDMFKTETLTKTVTIGANGSFSVYLSASEWQKNYYSCIGLIAYDVDFAYISQVKIDYNSSHQTLITLNNPRSSAITSATMTFTFLYVPTETLNTYAQRI